MPLYSFRNKKTGKRFDLFMPLAEREQYLDDNPNIVQEITGTAIVSGVGDVRSKIPNGFKDLLGQIKKNTKSRRFKSGIETA